MSRVLAVLLSLLSVAAGFVSKSGELMKEESGARLRATKLRGCVQTGGWVDGGLGRVQMDVALQGSRCPF